MARDVGKDAQLLSVYMQDSLAASLVYESNSLLDVTASLVPLTTEVWLDDRTCEGCPTGPERRAA